VYNTSSFTTLLSQFPFNFLCRKKPPALDDESQDFSPAAVRRINGKNYFKFIRKLNTGDETDKDFDLSEPLYFLFPVSGGIYEAGNFSNIRKHSETPMISEETIDVQKCK